MSNPPVIVNDDEDSEGLGQAQIQDQETKPQPYKYSKTLPFITPSTPTIIDDSNDTLYKQNQELRNILTQQNQQIEYLKQKAIDANLQLDQNILIPPIPTDPINGWSISNINTLESWKTKLIKATYIYDVVLEKYTKRLDRVLIWAAILAAISTLISGIAAALLANTTTTNTTVIWVVFGANIIISIISSITTVLSAIIKIKGWDTYVKSLNDAIRANNSLYAIIDTQCMLPINFREQAITFLPKYSQELTILMDNSPNISVSDYEEAERMYNRSLIIPSNIKMDFKIVYE